MVILQRGENPREYDVIEQDGLHIIRELDNGDCVYLRRGFGCTIWDRAPQVCQQYNCAKLMDSGHPMQDSERAAAERIKQGLTGLGNDREPTQRRPGGAPGD